MAVGNRFNDPATQAALQAQQGEPAEVDQPKTTQQEPTQQEPTQQTQQQTQEPQQQQQEPGVDLNMGDPAAQQEPTQQQEPAEGNQPDPSLTDLDKMVTDAGFDLNEIGKVLHENDGKIPDDLRARFKEKFDPALVDAQIGRYEAEYKIQVAETKKAADETNKFIFESLADGDATKGAENFEVLKKWSRENLSKDEIEGINEMLRSSNKTVIKQGLAMAVNKWKGAQQKMMTGDTPSTPTQPTFEPLSREEFKQIMRSEKYKTDPEYQAQIDERRRKTQKSEAWTPPGFHQKPAGW